MNSMIAPGLNAASPANGKVCGKLLDVDVTLTRFADDRSLLAEVASVFVRTVPQLVASISTALDAKDLKGAFHQAHSLKGAVAAFEAPEVLKAVLELERCAKSGDAAGTGAAYPVAHQLVEQLLDELRHVGASAG